MLVGSIASRSHNQRRNNVVAAHHVENFFRSRRRVKIQQKRHIDNLDYKDKHFPVREYLQCCNIASGIVKSAFFSNYMFFCIVLAGVLIGLETYPQFNENLAVTVLDEVVLYSFLTEVVLKILNEGIDPSRFFVGKERGWNLFDFVIVVISFVYENSNAGKVKSARLVRLVRLLRLLKVFRSIPQLQMIVSGLFSGFNSILDISLMIFLTIYVFGIAGIIFFRENDPWNFYNVGISMLTLLRVSTIDRWADVMYVNMFGCDGFETEFYTSIPSEANPALGGVKYCATPRAQYGLAVTFFVVFVVLVSFSMLSLFIGAISGSMSESLLEMHNETKVMKVENGKWEFVKVAVPI